MTNSQESLTTTAAVVKRPGRVREDITGKVFGRWTAICYSRSEIGRTFWKCRCECGKERDVAHALLKAGKSRGCKACSAKHRIVDLSGQKFGLWTVLYRVGSRGNHSYFLCRCDCGTEKQVSLVNLKSGCAGCFRCAHESAYNARKRANIELNDGDPILHGTREYAQAASCKIRSKLRGMEFGFKTISAGAKWIKDNTPTHCPVLGIPLVTGTGHRKGFKRDMPSVDRIDSTRGYTPDNMMVMSMQANTMKSDASKDELIAFAKWVLRTFPE